MRKRGLHLFVVLGALLLPGRVFADNADINTPIGNPPPYSPFYQPPQFGPGAVQIQGVIAFTDHDFGHSTSVWVEAVPINPATGNPIAGAKPSGGCAVSNPTVKNWVVNLTFPVPAAGTTVYYKVTATPMIGGLSNLAPPWPGPPAEAAELPDITYIRIK